MYLDDLPAEELRGRLYEANWLITDLATIICDLCDKEVPADKVMNLVREMVPRVTDYLMKSGAYQPQ